ncbi:MAG: Oxaloacetate decarboxylase, gamma chain [Firmicutes bacterium ADurb.Bin193]|nr:MAG: Oxaloacetate decarboxylase, gamma chain [Firmicutes bacterium ADurb.Bin193]
MSMLGSLVVSLFMMALVFVVLSILCAMVIILSKVLALVGNKGKQTVADNSVSMVTKLNESTKESNFSTGELKLIGTDEKTAAIIMAIVSHESKIPLSSLIFKSIKVVE